MYSAKPADQLYVQRSYTPLLAVLMALLFVLLALPLASAGATGLPRSVAVHHHERGHKARKHRRRKHHRKHKAHKAHHSVSPAKASDSCAGSSVVPNAENIEAARAVTLCLINAERAHYGERPLVENPRLTASATGHSYDMVARDYFEHISPTGQTLLTRVRASKFVPNNRVGYTLGENIAWGTLWLASPRSIVNAWMSDPGHRANILDRSFRYSGIGIDPSLPASKGKGQAGAMYTQDFGTIIPG